MVSTLGGDDGGSAGCPLHGPLLHVSRYRVGGPLLDDGMQGASPMPISNPDLLPDTLSKRLQDNGSPVRERRTGSGYNGPDLGEEAPIGGKAGSPTDRASPAGASPGMPRSALYPPPSPPPLSPKPLSEESKAEMSRELLALRDKRKAEMVAEMVLAGGGSMGTNPPNRVVEGAGLDPSPHRGGASSRGVPQRSKLMTQPI